MPKHGIPKALKSNHSSNVLIRADGLALEVRLPIPAQLDFTAQIASDGVGMASGSTATN